MDKIGTTCEYGHPHRKSIAGSSSFEASGLLELGNCPEQMMGQCQSCHLILNIDILGGDRLPRVLNFTIIRVQSCVKYWVRLFQVKLLN